MAFFSILLLSGVNYSEMITQNSLGHDLEGHDFARKFKNKIV